MNKTFLQIAGVVGIVGGCVALYLSGTSADAVTAIVGATFTLAGIIASVFGFKSKK